VFKAIYIKTSVCLIFNMKTGQHSVHVNASDIFTREKTYLLNSTDRHQNSEWREGNNDKDGRNRNTCQIQIKYLKYSETNQK